MANSSLSAEISSFTQLCRRHQKAVELKVAGRSHYDICQALRLEFTAKCSVNTVNHWFARGGLLRKAYDDYNVYSAEQALVEAGYNAKRAIAQAIETLTDIMSTGSPHVRLQAAQTALKLIPVQQVTMPADDQHTEVEAVLDRLDEEYNERQELARQAKLALVAEL